MYAICNTSTFLPHHIFHKHRFRYQMLKYNPKLCFSLNFISFCFVSFEIPIIIVSSLSNSDFSSVMEIASFVHPDVSALG